ncbi:hypothetical protein WN943_016144 [Citrus x changshan-huyou]
MGLKYMTSFRVAGLGLGSELSRRLRRRLLAYDQAAFGTRGSRAHLDFPLLLRDSPALDNSQKLLQTCAALVLKIWEGNMRPMMKRHVSIFKRLICLGYPGYLGYSRYPGYPKDSGCTSGLRRVFTSPPHLKSDPLHNHRHLNPPPLHKKPKQPARTEQARYPAP